MAAAMHDLELFVRDALAKGASRDEIEAVLTSSGWPVEQSREALSAYADVEFPVPVPRPRPYLSAREAFLYLVLFATLYVSAYHLGGLLFDFINRAFPDPADTSYSIRQIDRSMRWSVAALVIAFPVFLFVARHLGNELARNPVHRQSLVRRWLTYLTLFLAAAILVGDMITLVYSLLDGALSVRFVFKVLVVAVISGTIFGYYLLDLRRDEKPVMGTGPVPDDRQPQAGRWLAIAASVVVVLAVGVAIMLMRSPSAQRGMNLDTRRVQDLQRIVQLVDLYVRQNNELPADIAALETLPGQRVPMDPVDGTPYDYQATGGRGYRLCASFITDSARTAADQAPGSVEWNHGAGRQCFDRTSAKKSDSR